MANLYKGKYGSGIGNQVILGKDLTPEDISKINEIDSAQAELDRRIDLKRSRIASFGIVVLFLFYPIYLLIRFILWAIKTLKEKK